jgi:hypothetical protein
MVRAAVLVVIDNVARFSFESPQEEWHLGRHFPTIAPPWPKAFYEFRVPRLINLGKKLQPNEAADARVGLLMHAESIHELLAGRRARRGSRPLSRDERQELVDYFGPYADSLVWGTADQDVYPGARHWVAALRDGHLRAAASRTPSAELGIFRRHPAGRDRLPGRRRARTGGDRATRDGPGPPGAPAQDSVGPISTCRCWQPVSCTATTCG